MGGVRRAWAPLALTVVGLFSVPACSDDSAIEAAVKALGQGCLIDSDCEGELVCAFRRCHVECESTKDCRERSQDTLCVIGERPTNVCLLPDEAACPAEEQPDGLVHFSHSACPGGDMRCARDGSCRDRCQTHGDCVGTALCSHTGVCAEPEELGEGGEHPELDGDEPAGPSASCGYNSQCIQPLACRDGICAPACREHVDCPAGLNCVVVDRPPLGPTHACRASSYDPNDPLHCFNFALDGDETDEDCGGSCDPCPSGYSCDLAADCASGVCTSGICQVPKCSDAVRNGLETDVDCGGPQCAGCGAGQSCGQEDDCLPPNLCTTGTCAAPSCSDGVKNEDESDIDCGGIVSGCGACAPGDDCAVWSDCESNVCASGQCQADTCDDGVQNNTDESDVDCGGSLSGCARCGIGASCAADGDCHSGKCTSNLCAAPSCGDGVHNGHELAVDCGGGCPLGCALGTACTVDADCDDASPAGCHPVNLVCAAMHTLQVTLLGTGTGKVTSDPAGHINCGNGTSICSVDLYDGASLDLEAAPVPPDTFAGFGGDCSGTSCTVTISGADAAVSATFNL